MPLYACLRRSVTSVWLALCWRVKYEPFNSGSYHFSIGCVLYPVNLLLRQKCAIRHGTRKPYRLKVRRYVARLIDLNEYLAFFPGEKLTDKIVIYLNKIVLNSITNSWSKQAYVQVFDCKSINFKRLQICLNTWVLLSLFTKV